MAKALQLTAALKAPARLNKKNPHPFRLKVKELRYVLQLADRADQQEFVNNLGDVKDAIGEWNDWEELTAIATDLLNHGRTCKLIPKLSDVSERKYRSALSLTNQMRQRFLVPRAAQQQAGNAHKLQVIKPPIVAATSALSAQELG
jgi:CHAD domain-containing protein